MTYTQIGIAVVIAAIVVDVLVLRTRLVTRKGFWVSYAIVLFFQLLTNGVLTRLEVFRYSDSMIVGNQPDVGAPPFIGNGRIAYQPFEDLLMGFSLCLLACALWIFWGRRGVQRTPMSGPPIWRTWSSRSGSGGTASSGGAAASSPASADPRGTGDGKTPT
ncbi:MAG: lycopene cyclase domain-containing protein [Candidatus Nanopelagicales bacterium]|jgi:hypothetical protein